MHRGPRKHFGSLRQRLDQAGLTHLSRTPSAAQPVPVHSPGCRQIPLVSLRKIVLLLLVHGAIFLFGRGASVLMPVGSMTPADVPAPPRVVPVVHYAPVSGATAQNVEDLAQILMSEASPGVANTAEWSAVGYTVLNRMQLRGTGVVRDVWDAYAHHAPPTDEARMLAAYILRGEIIDPSGGATHFYSPRSMPMEGDTLAGFDTSGGLEQTPGLPRKNYRPGWAAQYEVVVVVGARASHYKFYRQPDPAFQ